MIHFCCRGILEPKISPMMNSLIVVDDFLNDPHALRSLALAQEYPGLEEDTYFPGKNSLYPQRINGLKETISAIVGEPLKVADGSANAKFRMAFKGDKGTAGVHIDDAHWSGLLYLSLPEHCKGGTEFYRHIPTGTDHAPMSQEDFGTLGMTSAGQIWDEILWPHTNDKSKWEHLMTVPMRFNRLVLFRPQQWHDAGPGFGNCPENARLIYMMFFKSAA